MKNLFRSYFLIMSIMCMMIVNAEINHVRQHDEYTKYEHWLIWLMFAFSVLAYFFYLDAKEE